MNCRGLSDSAVLTRLPDLLADAEAPARRKAARAGRPEAAPCFLEPLVSQHLMGRPRIAPDDPDAASALEALAPLKLKFRGEVRRKAESAAEEAGSAALAAEFRKLFSGSGPPV